MNDEELKYQIGEAARLLETALIVADGCMALVAQPDVPDVSSPSNTTDAAFSFLPRNQDSPHGRRLSITQEDQARTYLSSLGYKPRTVSSAIYDAHDADPQYRTNWHYPHYGLTAREAEPSESRVWARTASVTVTKPEYARRAVEKGWGMFGRSTSKRAALLLILRASEVTPEDLDTIQSNLDSWDTATNA